MSNKSKKNFVRINDSEFRFVKRTLPSQGGGTRSINILQQYVDVRYGDGSTGKEWLDVPSMGEDYCKD